jgi:hypothetical protein
MSEDSQHNREVNSADQWPSNWWQRVTGTNDETPRFSLAQLLWSVSWCAVLFACVRTLGFTTPSDSELVLAILGVVVAPFALFVDVSMLNVIVYRAQRLFETWDSRE